MKRRSVDGSGPFTNRLRENVVENCLTAMVDRADKTGHGGPIKALGQLASAGTRGEYCFEAFIHRSSTLDFPLIPFFRLPGIGL